MKNSNVVIALVIGLVLGLIIGRMTMDPDTTTGTREIKPAEAPKEAVVGEADKSEEAVKAAATDEEIFNVDISKARIKGSDQALVTIAEFSNYQCGFCVRAQDTLKELMKHYGDKVRVAYLPMPMQNMPATHLAAQAAEAAGQQGKFWEYHEKLFANNRALGRQDLERYAQELGLDMNRFRSELDNETHKKMIDDIVAMGQGLGVTGTPNFFINGRPVRGALPVEEFKKIIAQEITRAERVLKAGVSRENLYATLVESGKSPTIRRPPPERPQPPERQRAQRPQFGRPDISDANVKGPEDALVTIVEFSNIQCGFCVRVRPTVARIKEEYGDQVRFVYKHQTRPGPGQLVAEAAEAAGEQGKFFEFLDLAFESPREIARENLEAHAQALGLNMSAFRNALDTNKFEDRISKHRSDGMRVGARGTPTFFINGRLIAGAQPFDNFKRIIDEEIAKARKLLAEGTPRGEIHDRIMQENEKEFGQTREGSAPSIPPRVRPETIKRLPEIDRGKAIQRPERPERPSPSERTEIDFSTAPVKGNPNAKVTIVEFSSFACGFCGRVQPTINQIMREYGNDVKLAFMHRPMGPRDELAAQATLAAHEQGKFWEYHEKLFQNMRAIERPDLERYAEEMGLDMNRFRSALDDAKFKDVVSAQNRIAMASGVRGTPTFFINGRMLVGAQPFDAFKEIIDDELGR